MAKEKTVEQDPAKQSLEQDIARLTSEANQHLQQAKSFEAMYLKTLGAIDVLTSLLNNKPMENNNGK